MREKALPRLQLESRDAALQQQLDSGNISAPRPAIRACALAQIFREESSCFRAQSQATGWEHTWSSRVSRANRDKGFNSAAIEARFYRNTHCFSHEAREKTPIDSSAAPTLTRGLRACTASLVAKLARSLRKPFLARCSHATTAIAYPRPFCRERSAQSAIHFWGGTRSELWEAPARKSQLSSTSVVGDPYTLDASDMASTEIQSMRFSSTLRLKTMLACR